MRTSLVAQWLRLWVSTSGAHVRFLVKELISYMLCSQRIISVILYKCFSCTTDPWTTLLWTSRVYLCTIFFSKHIPSAVCVLRYCILGLHQRWITNLIHHQSFITIRLWNSLIQRANYGTEAAKDSGVHSTS